jgi:hypothetical protein
MTAPFPAIDRGDSRDALPRVAIGLAAAFGLLVASGVAAAAVGAPATEATAPVESVAQRLAAAPPTEAVSCDADAAAAPGFTMAQFGGGVGPQSNHAPLAVQCALPYATGRPGGDCTGRHTIQYASNRSGATFTAELMGLDANGSVLHSFLVENGDTAQLASRISPSDWKFTQNKNQYAVFAPIPVLKVTARHEGETAVAYCSNIPWVDLVQPNGGVVTDDGTDDGEGTTQTKVFAAVPRTSLADLHLYLDGVDLLAPGVITPALPDLIACTVDYPCSGTAMVNGNAVLVTDLVVDIASDIDRLSSNTVSATLNDLECGGHVVRVETTKAIGSLRNPMTDQCLVDDLRDSGSASVFTVTIHEPEPLQITPTVPTPVKGLVCGGTDLISVNISGKALDVSSQQKVLGDGVNTGDVVTFVIDTDLDQADLRKVFDGEESSLGRFASGSNRLVAAALEAEGNRAYRRRIFAVGSNIKPLGVDPSATVIAPQALQSALSAHLSTTLEAQMFEVMNSPTSTTIDNAFIVGLSSEGVNTIMHKLCESPLPDDGRTLGQIFKEAVEDVLDDFTSSNPLTSFNFDPLCSCETTVKVYVDSYNVGADFACPVTFGDGEMAVSLKLPDVTVTLKAHGPKKTCVVPVPFPPFVLPSHTEVNATATVRLEGIHFDYTITEGDILGNSTTVGADPFQIDGTVEVSASGGPDYGVGGDVCNFLVDAFVTVLTFGQVDIGPLLYLQIDITEKIDLKNTLTPAKPGAVPMKAIYIEEQTVDPYHQKMSGEIALVSDIKITPDGITAGLRGTFATTKVDLDVEGTPGFEAKEPPLLTMGQMSAQGAQDALVGLSDDAINMMFLSLAGGGSLKAQGSDEQGCFATGATLGTLLPPDCDEIDIVGADLATAIARGQCYSIKGANCSTLAYPGDPGGLASVMRGVCHGATGNVCASVFEFDYVNLFWCEATPFFNLKHDQNLMFCAKADIPTMGFPNVAGASNTVPTELHMQKVSVALVIDRSGPGNMPNEAVDALLRDLPGCFTGTQTASDCSVLAACTDINLNFAMENIECEDKKPGFRAVFDSVKLENFEVGIVCSGQTTPTNEGNATETASDDSIRESIALNAEAFSPPICGAGLDAGGFVSCVSPQIVALEADGDTRFRDYLAITCTVQ